MGYESTLHLVGVKIRPDCLSLLKKVLITGKGTGLSPIRYFLKVAVLDNDGYLCLKVNENYPSPYEPDEDDNTVPALSGKWYEAEKIAHWLKQYAEKDGRIILHSCEGDGEAWGWEFNGRGKIRALSLRPIGKWE